MPRGMRFFLWELSVLFCGPDAHWFLRMEIMGYFEREADSPKLLKTLKA